MEKTEQIPVKMSDETQNIPEVISTAKPDEKKQSVGALIEVLPRTLHQKAKLILRRIQISLIFWATRLNTKK